MRYMRQGVRTEFRCPKCGSQCYGSSDHGQRRNCQEGPTPPCGFRWPIADDWKYFTANGRRCASQAEFEQLVYVEGR